MLLASLPSAAQSPSDSLRRSAPAALRTPPTVAWSAALGFRDWGDLLLVNDLVIAGNPTGSGGLFAIDARTGKRRWAVSTGSTAGEAPASDGRYVVVAWTRSLELAAYTVADGRPVWSKPFDPVDDGTPLVVDDLLVAQHEDGFLYAFDVATGAERWKLRTGERGNWCAAGRPALADGVLATRSPPTACFTWRRTGRC